MAELDVETLKVLREMLDAHVEEFISDSKTLDDWLDNGPKNQRWLLTRLDVAILNAVIALGHEWAERAKEILAENERWRPRIRAALEDRDD